MSGEITEPHAARPTPGAGAATNLEKAMSVRCTGWTQSARTIFVHVGLRVGVILAAISYGALEAAADQSSGDASPITFFRNTIRRDLSADIAAIRPAPLSAAAVRHVEDLLPQRGELQPTPQEAQKISTVRAILRFHDRDVIVIKVIDVPQAVVRLHARRARRWHCSADPNCVQW